jgi:hypothetical protein
MNASLQHDLNDALNSLLIKASIRPQEPPVDQHRTAKATENTKQPSTSTVDSDSVDKPSSRRDTFLDKLPATQQVEILKWAEQQNIKPDEALWLLIDLMGYTKFMTETLPNRMSAAGQQVVDAITLQRQAEADAFSCNTQKALREMLASITAQVAHESENISELRLRKKLWHHSLLVAGGIMVLSAMCFSFGYMFGNVHLSWLEQSNPNQFIQMGRAILGLPVGYLIMPLFLTAWSLMVANATAEWRRQRQLYQGGYNAWRRNH